MKISPPCLLLLLVSAIHLVDAGRILALLTTMSPSHHIWNRALMLELASRGHQVTVFSPDPEKKPVPNHTDVVIEGVYDQIHDEFDFNEMKLMSKMQAATTLFDWGVFACDLIFQSPGTRKLMDMAEAGVTFDLIIVEVVLEECVFGFIEKFGNPPVVGMTAFSIPPWTHHLVGNEVNPSYVNTYDLPYSDRMSFLQRATNALYHWYILWYRDLVYLPQLERQSREFFGSSVSHVKELEKKISLVLVNTHFSMDYPQPLLPAIIPVAGMHIKKPQPLQEDLKQFLDQSSHGVIFFSLGTNIRSDQLGDEALKALLKAFAEIPQRVLWKFESDALTGMPKNVKVSKWLPQGDILAHPNVVVFMSHCGLLSTQEAIYHGVPVVGLPFFADQNVNLQKLMLRGVALELDASTMTAPEILAVLREVTLNPRYKDNMKKLSGIFRDQLETPLERAVYWTEYVLRHGGAPHLRAASLDLSWYQRLLLDVVGTALLAVAITLVLCYSVARRILTRPTKVKSN